MVAGLPVFVAIPRIHEPTATLLRPSQRRHSYLK